MTFQTNKGLKMRRFWPLFIFAIILSIVIIGIQNSPAPAINAAQQPQRIISLSPSITETLFAIGAGSKVVGITKYCDFPAATESLPKVGGFVDPNIEAIVALKPDLVILLANHGRVIKQLKQLNIDVLAVRNSSLSDIKQTISTIAERIGHQAQAEQVLAKIHHKIDLISTKVANKVPPRVMIAMGHSTGEEQVKQVFIAGNRDFYNDLIQLAGGINAYQGDNLKVPSVSIEGIMEINPHVIIDIFPEADDHNSDLEQTRRRWNSLRFVDAIKNKRVHIIEENYATIPGPRIFLLLEQIVPLIHPDIDWQNDAS